MTPAQIIPSISPVVETVVNNDVPAYAGLFGLGLLFFIGCIILLAIASLILWIWSIVHIAKNQNFADENTKLIWLLLVIFIGPIVSLIYIFARPKKKI